MCRAGVAILVLLLAACGSPSSQARETQAIEILRAVLPASTREAQGLPFGGWSARTTTDALTITLPLNADTDIEQSLRSARAALVRGAAQVFSENNELEHLTIVGTLPYGPERAEIPLLIGDITRADVTTWDGASDQLGLWKMSVPQ